MRMLSLKSIFLVRMKKECTAHLKLAFLHFDFTRKEFSRRLTSENLIRDGQRVRQNCWCFQLSGSLACFVFGLSFYQAG